MFYSVLFILIVILAFALWKMISLLLKNKKLHAFPYLIIFLGFGTIPVSIFYPGGFEGMGAAAMGLAIGAAGVLWLLLYIIIIKKVSAK